jgi:tetratricopeptide (TPR) repeat protein
MVAAQHNLAVVLADQGRFQEAIAAYSRAIELKPDSVEARCHLAELYLLLGDFERGWKEHEWRLPIAYPNNPRRWDGGELNGKTILPYGEQEFGDVIQFVRYVPMVAEKGGRIIFVCHEKLIRLLASMPHIAQIVSLKQPTPPFDVFCPLLSLPLALGTALHAIPANVPYLKSERPRLGKKPGVLRVGLAWAGNPEHWDDLRRSIPLDQFAPLSAIPGIEFYSLQVGPAPRQANDSSAPLPLIDLTSELQDFADTATLIESLDLVITVDTVVAHLAGAMGKPVWVLLAAMPDWRWMLDRADSPWYPTMRLFRQESTGSWSHVIWRIADSLAELNRASGQQSIGRRCEPQQ